MSAWDFDRPGGAREQFGWDEEPEWNFDSLEGQHEDDWYVKPALTTRPTHAHAQ